jgi:hypothetical protein
LSFPSSAVDREIAGYNRAVREFKNITLHRYC